jgi:AcrR family transcriptional regulator
MDQITDVSVLSRKEREKKARQQEILLAARVLFAEKGFHDTTLEEIAHKAEFAKGTIYNYFANKDELFYGIMENVFDGVHSIAVSDMSIEGAGAREKLKAYARSIISHSMDHSDFFKLMIREVPRQAMTGFDCKMEHLRSRDLETRKVLAHVLGEEINSGQLKPYDPMEIAFLFDGMLRFYCINHIKTEHPLSAADIDHAAELIVAVFFDGIQNK